MTTALLIIALLVSIAVNFAVVRAYLKSEALLTEAKLKTDAEKLLTKL